MIPARRVLVPAVLTVAAAGCASHAAPTAQPVIVTTGLHLEAPWWEAIKVIPAPSPAAGTPQPTRTVTITIPSDVLFATNSSTIDAHGRQVLSEEIAPMLRPATAITLAGSTDHTGTAAYNYTLGLSRAEACKTVLAAGGIPSASMHTVSWGATRPIADENGPDPQAARAQDRRVTVIATIPTAAA